MADVKEFIPKTIYDLVKDPSAPDKPYYEKFYDLPVMEKFDLISRLGKNDPIWMKASDDERIQFIRDNNLIHQKELPAASGEVQTGEQLRAAPPQTLSPTQAVQNFFQGGQRLTHQPSPEELEAGKQQREGLPPASALTQVITSVARAPLTFASGVAGGTGDVLNTPVAVSQLVGGPGFKLPIGSDSVARTLGISPESMSGLEHALQTVGGFMSPGLFLKAAEGAGILPSVAQKLYRFFSAGAPMDAALGATSFVGSEIGKQITPGSPAGPVIGGVTLPLVAGLAHTAGPLLKDAAQRRTLDYQGRRITEKATEAFGGPPLQEQLAGGTATQTAQQGALENFVEAQKQPVLQTQASRGMSEQLLQAQQSRTRMLNSDLTQRLRTSDDTAIAALDQSTQRLHAVEARITTERQTSQDAVRQMQEQGAQLGEDRVQQLRTAKQTADANIAALTQQRSQITQQMKESVQTAETVRTAVQVDARTVNKQAQRQLTSLEDDLARITTANEKDMNDYLTFAQKHVESLAPDMATATTPEAKGRIGRAAIQTAGEAGQDISGKVAMRLRDNAAAKYGILHSNYGIEEEAGALNDIVKKYAPAFEQPPAAPGELQGVTEQIRGSFAPSGAVRDFNARVMQIAEDTKVRQGLTDAPDLNSVQLGLPDMQRFRSQLMDDLRHTPPTSQNYPAIKQLYSEVNEYFWGLGRKYPEAFDALNVVNHWYDTEVHRLMGDAPFSFANITNPLTRERLHTPDEVARAYFGAGPGVAEGTATQADNAQRFVRYIDDLNEVIASVHLNRDQHYLSPRGYEPTVNQPATLADAAAARNAKDALFDAVRVQFYDAATDVAGKYVPEDAAKWLKQHATLIDANAELRALFQTPRNQANAIRDVQAKAQGLQILPEAYVQGMRDVLKVTQAEGGEAIFQARLNARLQSQQARVTAEQAQVPVDAAIAREGETLADVRQRLADAKRAQSRQEQLARFNREDVTARTGKEMVQAQLTEEQVRGDVAITRRGERRSLVDERTVQTENQRQATESLQRSKENESQALEEYNRMFGSRNAAEHALTEDTFKRTMGTTPEDIVAQIETMNPQDRNFAYAQWFKKPGMGEPEKEALLQARWQNFLGTDTVPDPAKAADFITKNAKWLQTYYPDYYDNITHIQGAFEKWDTLAQNQPKAFTQQHIGVHVGITGTGFALAKILGFGWDTAAALGFSAELGIQGMSRALYMRKIGALSQTYMHPGDAAIIANALRPRGTPNVAKQAAWSVLTHAGVIGRNTETEEAPQ